MARQGIGLSKIPAIAVPMQLLFRTSSPPRSPRAVDLAELKPAFLAAACHVLD